MSNKLISVFLAAPLSIMTVQPSYAWFFFFFPIPSFGSSTSSDPNEKCVSEKAKAGLLINHEGSVYRVKSIMGTSTKCTTDRYPILAITEKVAFEPRAPQVSLDLADGWQEKALTEQMKQTNTVTYAINTQLDIGIKLSSADARFVVDFPTVVRHYYEADLPGMPDREIGKLRPTTIAGLRAYQWEYSGTVNGKKMTYISTYILSTYEIVSVATWTLTANFQRNKPMMIKATNSIKGIRGGYQPKQSAETPHTSGKKEFARTGAAPTDVATKPNGGGAVDKLQDLKKMFDGGLITADEYGAKKKQILDGM